MRLLSVPSTVSPKSKPEKRKDLTVISRHARAVSFEERITRNPRPKSLDAEDVIRHALRCRGLLRNVASRFGADETATEIAIDVAARIVEMGSHRKYDPVKSSVDSWLVGAARNIYRKRLEVTARRQRLLSEGYATDPSIREVRQEAPAEVDGGLFESVGRLRARLTPTEAEVFDLSVRVGPDPSRISASLGIDPRDVREALRGIREAGHRAGIGGR